MRRGHDIHDCRHYLYTLGLSPSLLVTLPSIHERSSDNALVTKWNRLFVHLRKKHKLKKMILKQRWMMFTMQKYFFIREFLFSFSNAYTCPSATKKNCGALPRTEPPWKARGCLVGGRCNAFCARALKVCTICFRWFWFTILSRWIGHSFISFMK